MSGKKGRKIGMAAVGRLALLARSVVQLGLQPLAQPLLDHALVVQIAGPGQPLDPGQHAGIEAQRDGGAFPHIRPVQALFIRRASN